MKEQCYCVNGSVVTILMISDVSRENLILSHISGILVDNLFSQAAEKHSYPAFNRVSVYLSLKTEVIIEFLYGMWLLDLSDSATIT